MPAENPALVAVIGPVDPALFIAWTRHYRALDVQRFHFAFRFPPHVPVERRRRLQAACRVVGLSPAVVCTGEWEEQVDREMQDVLREQAGPGWHLLAGAEEFHQYPAPLSEAVAGADAADSPVVGGVLLDRVADDGSLNAVLSADNLDRAFPLGGHLTHKLLDVDPRRIVLARSDVAVSADHQQGLGHTSAFDSLAVVHHFAWHARALAMPGKSENTSSATAGEQRRRGKTAAECLHEHLERFDGRINVSDVRLRFRRVTLTEKPAGWQDEARRIASGLLTPTVHKSGR